MTAPEPIKRLILQTYPTDLNLIPLPPTDTHPFISATEILSVLPTSPECASLTKPCCSDLHNLQPTGSSWSLHCPVLLLWFYSLCQFTLGPPPFLFDCGFFDKQGPDVPFLSIFFCLEPRTMSRTQLGINGLFTESVTGMPLSGTERYKCMERIMSAFLMLLHCSTIHLVLIGYINSSHVTIQAPFCLGVKKVL